VSIGKFLQAFSFLGVLHSVNFVQEVPMPAHALEDDRLVEGGTGFNVSEKGVIREGVGDRPVTKPM
jgi:hypothetical protein